MASLIEVILDRMIDSAAIALVCSLVTAVEALIRALYTDVLTL